MAVAAPTRRSSAAPAPAPSRTTAPKRRAAAPATAPKRRKASAPATAPRRRKAAAPATAPRRRKATRGSAAPATAPRRAPTRAPQRARPKARPTRGQPRLALVVGRTAAGVRHLPDSGLIVRMTRGRAWIAVLGVLLVGIVGLNVVTLSVAASAGKVDEQITSLEKENSMLRNRAAEKFGTDRVRFEAAQQGLVMPNLEEPRVIEYTPQDIGAAAQRLAATG
jgi:hypothetical protein